MQLYEHQKKVVRSIARFKVTRGGRRGGKTVLKTETMIFTAVSKIVTLAREFPHRSLIFIAPTAKQARVIVWEAFKQRLGTLATYNESRLEIKLPTQENGESTIFVGGYENRENYRGMSNVVHIEFDEVDTMKNFFTSWEQIFLPMLVETGGSAGFGGTPKKENPNLRRLEKEAETDAEWESFHFTSWDNPNIPRKELEKASKEMDKEAYRQEILAEYVENQGALFSYTALVDVFSNTVDKSNDKYLIVDIADDGSDKTKFSFWEGLEEYRRETFERLNTENIIDKIREYASQDRIPFSHIAVDAIGVGAGVASSSMLDGIVGYKSSYAPIKTDIDIVRLPNVGYTKQVSLVSDYKNLRSQCIFILSQLVNNHKIASRVEGQNKENIIEELSAYQDVSKGDGKRFATPKEDIRDIIGRSPDDSDTWIIRIFFYIKGKMLPQQSEEGARVLQKQNMNFDRAFTNRKVNSNK